MKMKSLKYLNCLLLLQTFASAQVPLIEESKGLSIEEKAKQNLQVQPGPDWRLPGDLIPNTYDVVLIPDFYNKQDDEWGECWGGINYYVQCVRPTNKIILHGKDIVLEAVYEEVVEQATQRKINVTLVNFDEEKDFIIIELDGELNPGFEYYFRIEFVSQIPTSGSLRGLYYERYLDPWVNETRTILATQLQPVRARQVFPCFDEPTYKSFFNVAVFYEPGHTALGNGEKLESKKKATKEMFPKKTLEARPELLNRQFYFDMFNTTAKMPTYLFAIVVKHEDYYDVAVAPEGLYRLPVRVHGPVHLMRHGAGDFAANTSAKLMAYFESTYEIGYAMEKVDSISLRYKEGAMENYGLVTYGERFLMHTSTTTTAGQVSIISVIAHELGHQWFGNLVTCKWWSDIWLNEGFASFVTGEAMNALWPEYEMKTGMLEGTNFALRYDAGPNSHPIHREVYSADEISSNMDTITYDKGASIIRMMSAFLGEDKFYAGLRQYLRAFSGDVAEQSDLFGEFQKVADPSLPKTVEEIMNTWTLQKGFPLIRVSTDPNGNVVISQEEWEDDGAVVDPEPRSWDIPVHYMAEVGKNLFQEGDFWLLKEDRSETLPVQLGEGQVLLLNSDAAGYFRTMYDDDLKGRILKQLEADHTVFSPAGRVRLIDDQLTLGFQKYVPIQDALEFTKYLGKEEDPLVWSTVISHLNYVVNLYRNERNHTTSENFRALQSYLLPKVDAVIEKLDAFTSYERFNARAILKSRLVDWSCAMESRLCWNQTNRMFYDWWLWDIPYPEDLEDTLLCQFVNNQNDDDAVWYISRLIEFESDPIRRQRLVSALGCTRVAFEAYRIIRSIVSSFNPDYQITRDESIPVLQRLFTFSEFSRGALAGVMSDFPYWLPNYYRNDTNVVRQIFNYAPLLLTDSSDLEVIRDAYPEFYEDMIDDFLPYVWQNAHWMEEWGTNITRFMASQG